MEITSGPKVEIELAGARVTIPSAAIADLWVGKLRSGESVAAAAPLSPPRIGSPWHDGTFMGTVRGDDGAPDHYVIDLGEAPSAMNHAEATKWAEDKGGSLPTRREQALMFANRAEGQFKSEWYWSCEQYAGTVDYAWVQGFSYGGQGSTLKSDGCRARAVRRLTIQLVVARSVVPSVHDTERCGLIRIGPV